MGHRFQDYFYQTLEIPQLAEAIVRGEGLVLDQGNRVEYKDPKSR